MAISFLPVTARLRQRLGARPAVAAAELLSPPVERTVPPALCLPDDPDRILAYQAETTAEDERARAAGGPMRHGPTLIHRHRGAVAIDGTVYLKGDLLRVAPRMRTRPVATGPRATIERALLCTNPVIDRYFGHWLVDGLLLELLAAEQDAVPLTLSGGRWLHEPGYRALTGLSDRRERFVRIGELLVADDRGVNASWQARMLALRARIAAALPAAPRPPAPVFIRRGTSGSTRTLVNEAALAEALAARGFTLLAPEEESPATIAATLAAAPLVVLVEGSAQDHALVAAPPGAWIVTIMPPRRVNGFAKMRADAIGLNWAYTVADDAGDDRFHQPLDRLLRLIDLTRV